MKYLGVSRGEIYSPNRKDADRAVFQGVVRELESHGHTVECMTETELCQRGIPSGMDGIFQMARSTQALNILAGACVPVTNSIPGVMNCTRESQTVILQDCGYVPDSVVADTGKGVPAGWNSWPCWVKRGDAHAVQENDVCHVLDACECKAVISDFARRGISTCVLQQHVPGWILKFYGVRGFGIIDSFPQSAGQGKFGLERYNDEPAGGDCAYITRLKEAARTVSNLLGTDVYGGDAVVLPNGDIRIIDFNDWPSFGTCSSRAAQMIASVILNKK